MSFIAQCFTSLVKEDHFITLVSPLPRLCALLPLLLPCQRPGSPGGHGRTVPGRRRGALLYPLPCQPSGVTEIQFLNLRGRFRATLRLPRGVPPRRGPARPVWGASPPTAGCRAAPPGDAPGPGSVQGRENGSAPVLGTPCGSGGGGAASLLRGSRPRQAGCAAGGVGDTGGSSPLGKGSRRLRLTGEAEALPAGARVEQPRGQGRQDLAPSRGGGGGGVGEKKWCASHCGFV